MLLPFRRHINSTTVALALLLAVLSVAIAFGSKPALLASVLAMLGFNFFFLPPYHTFTIADPQNWIALTAFFVTSLAVGQLSARAKRVQKRPRQASSKFAACTMSFAKRSIAPAKPRQSSAASV